MGRRDSLRVLSAAAPRPLREAAQVLSQSCDVRGLR